MLDLRPDRIQNDGCFGPTVEEKTDEQRWAVGIQVASGTQHELRADGPA